MEEIIRRRNRVTMGLNLMRDEAQQIINDLVAEVAERDKKIKELEDRIQDYDIDY